MNGVSSAGLAELLREHLRTRTIENFCASHPRPDSLYRRVYDILHGKTELVSLRVADEICHTAGRPDWLQLLD